MHELTAARVPVLGIVATRSNSGKTTLIEKLIPLLTDRSIRTSVIKHVHHEFDMDTPGKDSFRFRSAGAHQVMAASTTRSILQTEQKRHINYPDLNELISMIDQDNIDLVLVEGFRDFSFAKLEVTRASTAEGLLCHDDSSILAIASKENLDGLPVLSLSLDDASTVVDFIADAIEKKLLVSH